MLEGHMSSPPMTSKELFKGNNRTMSQSVNAHLLNNYTDFKSSVIYIEFWVTLTF